MYVEIHYSTGTKYDNIGTFSIRVPSDSTLGNRVSSFMGTSFSFIDLTIDITISGLMSWFCEFYNMATSSHIWLSIKMPCTDLVQHKVHLIHRVAGLWPVKLLYFCICKKSLMANWRPYCDSIWIPWTVLSPLKVTNIHTPLQLNPSHHSGQGVKNSKSVWITF